YKDIHTLFTVCSNDSIVVKNNEDKGVDILMYGDFKLLLRPLSDLTKEIEHNEEKFVPEKELSKIDGEFYLEYDENIYLKDLSNLNLLEVTRGLTLINKLFEWHFDVFKLIGTHAINLNEVK